MQNINWDAVRTIVELGGFIITIWRLGVIAGRLHEKLDGLVVTAGKQGKQLDLVQRGLHRLWDSFRTLRGRVDRLESALPAWMGRAKPEINPTCGDEAR
jgi:hypothetical protein